jgi:hypothetical protein
MPKFVLLLRETPSDFQSWSPEEMQTCIERYRAWSDGLLAQGKMVGGKKLQEEGGRHVRRSNGTGSEVTVVDGPYAEAKEALGGLFEIEAADYDEAVALASTCPHLDFGWIEVRQIDSHG